jgi:spoIIIJ-associated protein
MTEIFTVKKMEQAKKMASETFGVPEDFIVFRVIEEKKGFFGKMKVEAIYDAPDAPATAPKAEAAAPETVTEKIATETKPASKAAPAVAEAKEAAPTAEDADAVVEPEEAAEPIALEELSQPLVQARNYIIAIYEKMGLEVEVTASRMENGVLMNVTSESRSGTIIGRRGETLDSIQYLASIIANRGDEDYNRIMLDSNGYRIKRRKTLENLAEKISRNVLRSGRATTLEPMNPYERRIIHSKVAQIEGVVSHSVGEDPYRKVVIAAVGGRKNRNGNGGRNNRNGNGKNRGNKKPYREKKPEDYRPSNLDNMKTSFEKDYKKPKPEDSIHTGLYGKIEL